MSIYNYSIDCESESTAKKLHDYISDINLYQDGLDVDESRVSVISKQSLLDELQRFSKQFKAHLVVEIWPESLEYDEAEASGDLESKIFDHKHPTGSPD